MSVARLTSESPTPVRGLANVRNPKKRGLKSMVAGGLTGAINIMIVFPTEYVKTQLQLDSGRTRFTPLYSIVSERFEHSGTALSSHREKIYTGSVDVVKKTVR